MGAALAKGRKRKTGAREKGGRPQRDRSKVATQENMLETMRPTLEARCKVMGWSRSEWIEARDPRLATLHGRLHLSKRLTEREYLGLSSYAVRHHRWRRAIEAPPGDPKGSRLETEPPRAHETPNDMLHHGPLPEDWEAFCKRATNEFMAAEGVLLATGRKDVVLEVLTAAEDVAPDDVPLKMLAAIKFAARKLARHFGHA